jgi:hypothetical protein
MSFRKVVTGQKVDFKINYLTMLLQDLGSIFNQKVLNF